MSRGSLLLVDLSNQAYKAAASHPHLSSGRNFTGGLFGVLISLCKAINDVGATRVVVCEDTKPYKRSLDFPAYKSDRKSSADETLVMKATETKTLCLELFNSLNIPSWKVPGFECDDIVAWAVRKYRNRYDNVIAMANDSDLYQLFEFDNFQAYRGKKGLYTKAEFIEQFGDISPDEFRSILALAGTHNAVPGIPGVGEVTAKKLLANPAKLREVRAKHPGIMERNMDLIVLPHPDFPSDLGLNVSKHVYNERSFIKFCSRYEITVTTFMREAFEKLSG